MNYDAINTKNYGLNFSFTLGHNTNEVVSLGSMDSYSKPSYWASTEIGSDYLVKPGKPVGTIVGYKLAGTGRYEVDDFEGYDAAAGKWKLKEGVADASGIVGTVRPGTMKLLDKDGSGTINDDDKFEIGDANAWAIGGFSIGARAYGFDFNADFSYSIGNDVYNADKIDQTDNGKVDEPLASYPQIMSLNYSGDCGITWTKTTRAHDSENFQAEATTCFSNQSTTAFSGYFAYGIKMANGTIARVSDYNGLWKLPAVKPDGRTYGTYDQNPTLTISYPFPQGINVIYPIYSSDTKNWHICSFYNNQPFIINVDATTLYPVTTPLAATVTAEDGLYTGMTNPLTVTFTNSMDMEFNGLVNIYTNTKDNTKPNSPDFDLYITIPARGSVTRQIELPETSSSQQYLWITDVANKDEVIVNGQLFTLTTAAAPNFTVVSSESNATPGKFGEGICYSAKCKLPLVEDDKLVVRFGVKNTGGPGYLDYCFVPYNAETNKGWIEPNRARAAGNGAITYVEYTVTPDEVGSHSILVYFNSYDFTTKQYSEFVNCMIGKHYYDIVTGSGQKWIKGNALIAYVTGVPSSISSVKTDSGTYVRGEKGAVVIKTDADKRVGVYHISGQKMAEVRLTAGQEQTVVLRPGLYIVDGIKMMVR